jgi:hypothetical protein
MLLQEYEGHPDPRIQDAVLALVDHRKVATAGGVAFLFTPPCIFP